MLFYEDMATQLCVEREAFTWIVIAPPLLSFSFTILNILYLFVSTLFMYWGEGGAIFGGIGDIALCRKGSIYMDSEALPLLLFSFTTQVVFSALFMYLLGWMGPISWQQGCNALLCIGRDLFAVLVVITFKMYIILIQLKGKGCDARKWLKD